MLTIKESNGCEEETKNQLDLTFLNDKNCAYLLKMNDGQFEKIFFWIF